MINACNPSTRKAGKSLQIQGQSGLPRELLPQNENRSFKIGSGGMVQWLVVSLAATWKAHSCL